MKEHVSKKTQIAYKNLNVVFLTQWVAGIYLISIQVDRMLLCCKISWFNAVSGWASIMTP